ncbi:hypothetical protein F4805DRAFT_316356 [Annulohypoxylon moriforme]|nr:hypothetical protein F4805DRAFT_316356 [Annulohypoxylon moriforme]
MSELRLSLLSALEDFRQIADVLGQNESSLDLKSFYFSLFAQCFQLHGQINEIIHPELVSTFLEKRLAQLESVIVQDSSRFYDGRGGAITYPGLDALHRSINKERHNQTDQIKLLKSCINFGTKDDQATLINLLKDGNDYLKAQEHDPNSQQADYFIPLKIREKPPDGIWPAANSLFQVLDSRKRCTCDPAHDYVVQLCLETHRAKLLDCDFDLYLGLGQVWQEARVQTATSLPSQVPTIVVDNLNPAASNSESRYCEQKRIVEKLCRDIIKITRTLPDYRLRFRLEKDSLWKLRSEESNFKIDKSRPPISLAQIIIERSNVLNEKTKRILSVLLSYAVFHLHGTPWLQSPWSSSNVMFLRSFSGVPLRPYIETHLNDSLNTSLGVCPETDEEDDFDPDDLLSPPYPCLVDLAVVLIELHKAQSLDSLALLWGIPIINEMDSTARYVLVREVFRHCRLELTDQTRMAINSCLDPNIGLNDNGDELDEYGLRSVIYQKIVRRLEDELEQGFSDLSVDKLDMLVQSMDLTNGGQPIRRELGRQSPDTTISTSKAKRRSSNETVGRRVRFLASANNEVSSHRDNSGSHHKEDFSIENLSSFSGKDDMSRRIKQLLPTPRKQSIARPDTIRVLNVPHDKSESELTMELEKLFGSNCKVHSLARASGDAHCGNFATVTFPNIPNEQLHGLIKADEVRLRGSFDLQYDSSFLGVTPLYDAGDEAMFDVIAIEGLGTNPFGTFRGPQGDEMWLRDYLPERFKSCRILLYGYDSKVPGSKSNQSVQEIAGTCKTDILMFRELTEVNY